MLEEIFSEFKDKIRVTKVDKCCYYLTLPFFFYNERESITLRYYEKDGDLYISDDGAAARYLDNGINDINNYRDRVEIIKRKFGLQETDTHEFILEFPDEKPITLQLFTGFFIQAISVIAYLKLFQ